MLTSGGCLERDACNGRGRKRKIEEGPWRASYGWAGEIKQVIGSYQDAVRRASQHAYVIGFGVVGGRRKGPTCLIIHMSVQKCGREKNVMKRELLSGI
eukprot:1349377-Amorphochlora_amoeboformis.AAC.1